MAKHWKKYLPQASDDEKEQESALPKNLAEAVQLSPSLRGLLDEREKLEAEVRALSGAGQEDTGRLPKPKVLSIDKKRKLESQWEKGRQKTKRFNGLVNKVADRKPIDKKSLKVDLPFQKKKKPASPIHLNQKIKKKPKPTTKPKKIKVREGLDTTKKIIAKQEQLDNKMEKGLRQSRSFVNQLDDGLAQANQFAKDQNLDLPILDKVVDAQSKISNKLDTVEKVFKKKKEKQDAIKRQVKKVDAFMNNDLVKRITGKKEKQREDQRFALNFSQAAKAFDDIKKVKKTTDDWMNKRDENRAKSKSKNGFQV